MHDKICDLLFSNVQLNIIFLVRFFEVTQPVLNCTYKQKTVKDLSSIVFSRSFSATSDVCPKYMMVYVQVAFPIQYKRDDMMGLKWFGSQTYSLFFCDSASLF